MKNSIPMRVRAVTIRAARTIPALAPMERPPFVWAKALVVLLDVELVSGDDELVVTDRFKWTNTGDGDMSD